jgi:hypothetical protein
MAGILNVLAAGSAQQMVAVIASNGSDGSQVIPGTSGTLTPSSVRGYSVLTIDTNPGGFDLRVIISSDTHTQTGFFKRVEIADGSGTLRTFTASSANSFTALGGGTPQSTWVWGNGTGADPLWTNLDGGETKSVAFYF